VSGTNLICRSIVDLEARPKREALRLTSVMCRILRMHGVFRCNTMVCNRIDCLDMQQFEVIGLSRTSVFEYGRGHLGDDLEAQPDFCREPATARHKMTNAINASASPLQSDGRASTETACTRMVVPSTRRRYPYSSYGCHSRSRCSANSWTSVKLMMSIESDIHSMAKRLNYTG